MCVLRQPSYMRAMPLFCLFLEEMLGLFLLLMMRPFSQFIRQMFLLFCLPPSSLPSLFTCFWYVRREVGLDDVELSLWIYHTFRLLPLDKNPIIVNETERIDCIFLARRMSCNLCMITPAILARRSDGLWIKHNSRDKCTLCDVVSHFLLFFLILDENRKKKTT